MLYGIITGHLMAIILTDHIQQVSGIAVVSYIYVIVPGTDLLHTYKANSGY